MKIRFQAFASGSSGNCYYLGTEKEGILIDAGISVRQVKKYLKELGIGFENLRGVIITHDHADHIKSVATLGEKYFLPIYCTEKTFNGINLNKCMKEKLSKASTRFISKDTPFDLAGFRITPFEIPHDAMDNVGFFIETSAYIKNSNKTSIKNEDDKNTNVSFCFLTDIGSITEHAANYIAKTNHLILEANYDDEMLKMGHYPPFLKERISSGHGHLSNKESATFLAEHIANRALDLPAGPLLQVWLCHLSQENNHPELAMKTFDHFLRQRGIVPNLDIQITILRRTLPTQLYEIGE